MKLTALEIKQQQFDKALRGYDVSEVNAYLNLVANEWEHLVGKTRELEIQLEKMDEKLNHYERVEKALHETLQTAKDNADQKLIGAKKEAKTIIERAEMEADSIVLEANQKRHHIRQSILRLLDRREEIISGMKSYLEMAQDSLQNFSRDDAFQFTLPKEDTDPFSSNSESHSDTSNRRSQKKDEQPIPPGSDNLDEILDDIE